VRIVGIVVVLGGLYFLRFALMPRHASPYDGSWAGLFALFMLLTGAGLVVAGTYPDTPWGKAIGWVARAGFRVIARFVFR